MQPIIIISGATGTGKSDLAIELALKINGEIINADSMQVYKYFDIGTAKPTLAKRKIVPHHLIDFVNPDEIFNASIFKEKAWEIITELFRKGKIPIIVGGTGLYIRALTENLYCGVSPDPLVRRQIEVEIKTSGQLAVYNKLKEIDPQSAAHIHPHDQVRIVRALEVYILTGKPLSQFHQDQQKKISDNFIYFIINRPRKELYERLNQRVDQMLSEGLIEEIKNLLAQGYHPELKPFLSLGYKQVINYLKGEYDYPQAVEEMKKETRHYAKRQLTWFRKTEQAIWIDLPFEEDEKQGAGKLLKHLPLFFAFLSFFVV